MPSQVSFESISTPEVPQGACKIVSVAWLRGMVWCCLLPLVSGGIVVSGLPFKVSLFSVALPIGVFAVLAVALWRTGWRGALGAVIFFDSFVLFSRCVCARRYWG